MSKDEALKLALEALVDNRHYIVEHESTAYLEIYDEAVDAVEKALAEQPAQQEPVALKWQQAPIKTQWGDEMVVASVAIDKDHTVCLYCERDQTPKVDAMFAQRTWVGLTDEEADKIYKDGSTFGEMMRMVEAKLKEKNNGN